MTESLEIEAPKFGRITDVDEFLRLSREEYSDDFELDKIDREEAESDNSFAYSTDASKSQWDPKKKKAREDKFRPVLQFNRIPIYLQHVCNAGRQNKPAVKITAGDKGQPETAEMLESRIRQVIYECNGDIARDTAREQQVSSGRGFIRITTEEIPGKKGKQRVIVEPILNQFSVIFGPHRQYDCSDAERCWVVTPITKAEHKRLYGDKSLLNQMDFAQPPGAGAGAWVNIGKNGEMVQIAEKFVKNMETGEVWRYVINGVEILEEGQALTDDIGIVPQWGAARVQEGIQRNLSLHNAGKDWQRLINLYASNIAENIGKQPKDRYTAALGSIPANMEDDWSGDDPKGVKYYRRYDDNQRDLGIPEIERWEPPIQALGEGLAQATDGLKSSMGIFDASLGERSNETSGVAINRRKVEGETTNFHFPDNEMRTWKRAAQIIIKLLSVLDKPGSIVTVRHYDGKTEQVPIGAPYQSPKTGRVIQHVLTDGDYHVEVEPGTSYANAKEQAEEAQEKLISACPELMFSGVGVNWLRNSARPGADEDAEALERYIQMKTPGLIPPKDQEPVSPQAQAQIQGLTQQLQKAHAFAQSLHEQLQTKAVETQGRVQIQQNSDAVKLEIAKLETQGRIQLQQLQEETKRILGGATLDLKKADAKFDAQMGIIDSKVDRAHELHMKLVDQAHADSTQQAAQAHASDTQGQDQQFQAAQAQQAQDAAAQQPEGE